ncbi:helix-turn-helix domain-containing protein [Vibrio vulnificus]|nr:helix-turn-helix transcriptional regulator [Vibrio vulnificus]MCU8167009.1 helix-turn-helix domain-containing protein [Vibrio vulnificus]MCU8171448.1 helix-turn-helix domain-containing protein [Vibrio vulnificus]MCU8266220.1 helix-turn-helix domain-containing protein [Vibrio vulnificus]
MDLGKKIKAIRVAEGLSQPQMAELMGMPIGTLRNCEQDRTELGTERLLRITTHDRFKKYALWLVTNETNPESGQVAPDFSILLDCGVIDEDHTAPKRA